MKHPAIRPVHKKKEQTYNYVADTHSDFCKRCFHRNGWLFCPRSKNGNGWLFCPRSKNGNLAMREYSL